MVLVLGIGRSLLAVVSPQLASLTRMSSLNPSKKVTVAVCQMTSTPKKSDNLALATELIDQSIKQGATMVFLPEGFDSISETKDAAITSAESLDGPTIAAYRNLAKSSQVWLSLGGFKQKSCTDQRKLFNTHLIINSEGDIVSEYRKLHMFDVDIPGKVRLCESDFTLPGQKISELVPTPVGNVALSICYDLRFPELSTIQRQQGAEILTYPSAFTVPTGKAHWEVLLRSRAIENECFVVAAAQVGHHHSKRESYGHSMIVDPWGKVLCEIKDDIGIATAEIDLNQLQSVRKNLPVSQHARHDIYQVTQVPSPITNHIDDVQTYMFAQFPVPSAAVFYKSKLSFAFVNKKPVLPGHMLVSPLRIVKRFSDLSPAETADLFQVCRLVGAAVEKEFQAQSLTVTIQDGPQAGQSVEHVHVHILPRTEGDFKNNDDIYEKLATHDKTEEGKALPAHSPQWRSEETMAEEADLMRKHFSDS